MRYTATININGTEYQCERNIGDQHFPREVRAICMFHGDRGDMFSHALLAAATEATLEREEEQ